MIEVLKKFTFACNQKDSKALQAVKEVEDQKLQKQAEEIKAEWTWQQ